VPYKGEGPLNPDIIAGRVQSAFLSTANAIGLAKDGKLRPLAVLLKSRSPLLPEVPTIDEAGVPEVTVRQWAGVFGPPKMPREIVARLNQEVGAALKRQDVIDKLLVYGYSPEASTPEGVLEINRADLALWRKLIAEARLPLE
jgi:tripartite-type tricarboxylate transporter receptor subunit TctC